MCIGFEARWPSCRQPYWCALALRPDALPVANLALKLSINPMKMLFYYVLRLRRWLRRQKSEAQTLLHCLWDSMDHLESLASAKDIHWTASFLQPPTESWGKGRCRLLRLLSDVSSHDITIYNSIQSTVADRRNNTQWSFLIKSTKEQLARTLRQRQMERTSPQLSAQSYKNCNSKPTTSVPGSDWPISVHPRHCQQEVIVFVQETLCDMAHRTQQHHYHHTVVHRKHKLQRYNNNRLTECGRQQAMDHDVGIASDWRREVRVQRNIQCIVMVVRLVWQRSSTEVLSILQWTTNTL